MKTKAAEALAAGLMIIATKETYIGYQEALADPRSKGIMVQADSADAFIREIQERSKSLDLADVRNRATGLWASYYSRSRADRAIQQLVEEMIP
jgi:hypothetical protein